jgi:hypothetical protein
MDVKEYIKAHDRETVESVAVRAGTSVAYLRQLAGKHRLPSPDMARRLVVASSGVMALERLRPDIWGDEQREVAA